MVKQKKIKAIYKFSNGSKIEVSLYDIPKVSYMWGERFFLTENNPQKGIAIYEIRRADSPKQKKIKKVR